MEVKITGNKFIINGELIPEDRQILSASGKSKIVFSTHGFTDVVGTDMRISVNITKAKNK